MPSARRPADAQRLGQAIVSAAVPAAEEEADEAAAASAAELPALEAELEDELEDEWTASAAVSAGLAAGEPAAFLSYLRTHLAYDAVNARALAGWRAFAVLRGIRGVEGVRWATELLLQPPLDASLQDTRVAESAGVLQELVVALALAHSAEEQRLVCEGVKADVAAKFSQHHEGRPARGTKRQALVEGGRVGCRRPSAGWRGGGA